MHILNIGRKIQWYLLWMALDKVSMNIDFQENEVMPLFHGTLHLFSISNSTNTVFLLASETFRTIQIFYNCFCSNMGRNFCTLQYKIALMFFKMSGHLPKESDNGVWPWGKKYTANMIIGRYHRESAAVLNSKKYLKKLINTWRGWTKSKQVRRYLMKHILFLTFHES